MKVISLTDSVACHLGGDP